MPLADDSTFAYRLGQVEKEVEHKADARDLADLTDEVKGLRKVLVQLFLGIVGSTLVFAGGVIGIAIQIAATH